jgi:hypothetical protein
MNLPVRWLPLELLPLYPATHRLAQMARTSQQDGPVLKQLPAKSGE